MSDTVFQATATRLQIGTLDQGLFRGLIIEGTGFTYGAGGLTPLTGTVSRISAIRVAEDGMPVSAVLSNFPVTDVPTLNATLPNWTSFDALGDLAALMPGMRVFVETPDSLWASRFSTGQTNWIEGQDHNDLILGGAGADHLRGGEGQDRLWGGTENDRLLGQDGDDLILGQSGDDHLSGAAGDDRLLGGLGHDDLHGGAGDDQLYGEDGDDLLHGRAGDDALSAGTGNDVVYGGTGDDEISGGTGDDRLFGQWDDDILRGDVGDDLLSGQDGDDRLWGGAGNDRLNGGAGDDILQGEGGDDVLRGGVGIDWLVADGGDDSLKGGADADQFIFRNDPDRPGQVVVHDFDASEDRIALLDLGLSSPEAMSTFVQTHAAQSGSDVTLSSMATGGLDLRFRNTDLVDLTEAQFLSPLEFPLDLF